MLGRPCGYSPWTSTRLSCSKGWALARGGRGTPRSGRRRRYSITSTTHRTASSGADALPETTRWQPPWSSAPPPSPPAIVTRSPASPSRSPASVARTSRQELHGWPPPRCLGTPGLTAHHVGELEDSMQHEFPDWQRLVGRWAIEATHPGLPDTVVSGQSTFEWLEDQRFLIQRSHYDHPDLPDAVAVMGIIDGKPMLHYFDPRGVHRVFAVDISTDAWRFWNDTPGFSQRFTGTFSEDGNAINGQGELSRDDGSTWAPDLAITYRRIG